MRKSGTRRVLLLATTTGYQTRAFGEAAERLGVELVFATDRCHVLDDPWRDSAVPIRFHEETASVEAILASARPIDAVLSVGDRPAVIAARVLEALGLPGHPPGAAAVASNKLLMRQRLQTAGLLVPSFRAVPLDADPAELAREMEFPCVVKPLGLSGSRGVIRADSTASFVAAFERLTRLLRSPAVRAERSPLNEAALIEGFIPGREFAVEAIVHHGALQTLAMFDKPDPLDGPYFEETIYVTPSSQSKDVQQAIGDAVSAAVSAVGLRHGPVHAECRVNEHGVYVLETAARPIGGLCARALRFVWSGEPAGQEASLEEVLLRHALGEAPDGWRREAAASGVMMIPIPRRGILRRVDGADGARQVAHVTDVRLTAKLDHPIVPLPEGATYLGFIFARAAVAAQVEAAIRTAHARLRVVIDSEVPVVQSPHG